MNATPCHLIEPESLLQSLQQGDHNYLIVDLCSDQQYATGHLPDAVHVTPAELIAGQPPVPGKLPDKARLDTLFARIGLTPDKTVVLYDDEGGGWAGRLAWTLDVIGHSNWLYLNGGLKAWQQEGLPLVRGPVDAHGTESDVTISRHPIVEAEEIMEKLGEPGFTVWDARSRGEYEGTKVVAQRGGHIPGAIHCEWTSLMDPERGLRIRRDAREFLQNLGLSPDKSIVTHCQSHHRSGFTYMVARILGYPNIRAYHGSWSDWGNRSDTPVESFI